MNWELAIESKRVPLLGVVLALFAEMGLTEGGTVERITKPLHRFILSRLRSAESAVRRLIVAAARDIVVEYKPRAAAKAKPKTAGSEKTRADGEASPRRKRRPLFNLFDALKRHGGRFKKKGRRLEPHVYSVEAFLQAHAPAAPVEPEPVDDGMVSAKHLVRRLKAALDALQDIPRHALRLARWEARPFDERRPERSSPLRSGRPPGYRQRSKHEVDDLLKECDWLARLGNPPRDDTS
jgi:DNA-directed RNA polymerase specialized sigma24 family protein